MIICNFSVYQQVGSPRLSTSADLFWTCSSICGSPGGIEGLLWAWLMKLLWVALVYMSVILTLGSVDWSGCILLMAMAQAMKASGNTQDLLRPMSRTCPCYFCLNLLAREGHTLNLNLSSGKIFFYSLVRETAKSQDNVCRHCVE